MSPKIGRKDIVIDIRAKDYLSEKLQALSSYLTDLAATMKDFSNSLVHAGRLINGLESQLNDLKSKADKIDELFEVEIKDAEGKESDNGPRNSTSSHPRSF